MPEIRDITTLMIELEEAFQMTTVPDKKKFPKYREGTVLDEDKSVRWNREQVELANKKRMDEVSRLQKIRNSAINEVENEIAKSVGTELNISIAKAKQLYRMAYDDGHSFGSNEIYAQLDRYMDIVRMIMMED